MSESDRYDPIGNRATYTKGQAAALFYCANQLNQYDETGDDDQCTNVAETFTHDEDGNLETDGQFTYTWDAENRLIGVAPASSPVNGDQRLTFAYDYQNRRVRKIVEEYDGSSWSETLDRKFVWYNWLLLVEPDGEDDSVVKKYTWGADLSGQNGNVAASPRGGRLEGAGGIGGLLATRDEADSKSYVHFYDGNGNVTQMIDRSDDSTAAHYEYDAYGNVTYSDGAYKDTNRFQFSTKWWDDETGFGYWGYRYYLATLGRWANSDPIAEIGGVLLSWTSRHRSSLRSDPLNFDMLGPFPVVYESNLYSYVENASIAFIDSLGLQTTQPGVPPTSQPDGPGFPGSGEKDDPRNITSIYDFLNTAGDPGCGVCFRINPRGFEFSKARVLRVDPGCSKSAKQLEEDLAFVAQLAKINYWLNGFEEKCKADKQHPSHAGHSGCECECVNKKKLPRMHYTFHRVFRRVFLEYQLIPPYYKPKGCTGDFRLTATLKLDGWYGECRAKCKVQE
jgi:RHS repeat-associated protein